MPFANKKSYSSEDYWNLPEGCRAELIDAELIAMAPPNFRHQKLVSQFAKVFGNYIDNHTGSCEVIPAPFAVDLNADEGTYVEPDISVICDKSKITDRGCIGAPDFVAEIVSPSSRKMDYNIKNAAYAQAGVREYWIVDPSMERTTVYRYEEDAAPSIIPFSEALTVGIYGDLSITIADLL